MLTDEERSNAERIVNNPLVTNSAQNVANAALRLDAELRAAEAEAKRMRGFCLMLLEVCDRANDGAWSNGVTDQSGTMDEGDALTFRELERIREALRGGAE